MPWACICLEDLLPRVPPRLLLLPRQPLRVVTLCNRMKLYSFQYLWSNQTYLGVMAQDLLATPEWRKAVILQPAASMPWTTPGLASTWPRWRTGRSAVCADTSDPSGLHARQHLLTIQCRRDFLRIALLDPLHSGLSLVSDSLGWTGSSSRVGRRCAFNHLHRRSGRYLQRCSV